MNLFPRGGSSDRTATTQNLGGGPLRVFVSGTQQDLQEEREKAAEVIRSLGCEAILVHPVSALGLI